ncbi:MAG TPA: 50S ribosomal protein L6 [Desulfomonilia bacterium]|jgi:large subunit ribosomal protein L6
MSRIGKMPITIPDGVKVTLNGDIIKVKGPKGELSKQLIGNMEMKIEGNTLTFLPLDEMRQTGAYHGLMRALTNNMVKGVSEGFVKRLKIVGIGYRGETKGDSLILNVGYSHPVEYSLPNGVKAAVSKEGVIDLMGIDNELLGDVASQIRKIRPPDSYKGKGIRYLDENVRIKPGKSAAKGK